MNVIFSRFDKIPESFRQVFSRVDIPRSLKDMETVIRMNRPNSL